MKLIIVIVFFCMILLFFTGVLLTLNVLYKLLYDYDFSLETIFDIKDMLQDWFGLK